MNDPPSEKQGLLRRPRLWSGGQRRHDRPDRRRDPGRADGAGTAAHGRTRRTYARPVTSIQVPAVSPHAAPPLPVVLFITGPAACGKSTLAKLLQGFYFPQEGQITIDGSHGR